MDSAKLEHQIKFMEPEAKQPKKSFTTIALQRKVDIIILWNVLYRIDKNIALRVAKLLKITLRFSVPVEIFGAFGLKLSAKDCVKIAEEFQQPRVISANFISAACRRGWIVTKIARGFYGHTGYKGQLICWSSKKIIAILANDSKWNSTDLAKIIKMIEL